MSELFPKTVVDRLVNLSSELQKLSALAPKRMWVGDRTYTDPNTGEIIQRHDPYLNMEVDIEMYKRVDAALKTIAEAVKSNPGNQYYLSIEIDGVKLNAIKTYVGKVSGNPEIQFAKAYEPQVFTEINDKFSQKFLAIFSTQIAKAPVKENLPF